MLKACRSSAQSGSIWGSLVFSEVSEAMGTPWYVSWHCLDTELSEMKNFESLCEVFSILACSWRQSGVSLLKSLKHDSHDFSSWARASQVSEGENKLCLEFYLQAQCLKANQSQETKTQHCKAQGNKLESSYEALNSFQLRLSWRYVGQGPPAAKVKVDWIIPFTELPISHHWLMKEPIMVPIECLMLYKMYRVLFFRLDTEDPS